MYGCKAVLIFGLCLSIYLRLRSSGINDPSKFKSTTSGMGAADSLGRRNPDDNSKKMYSTNKIGFD